MRLLRVRQSRAAWGSSYCRGELSKRLCRFYGPKAEGGCEGVGSEWKRPGYQVRVGKVPSRFPLLPEGGLIEAPGEDPCPRLQIKGPGNGGAGARNVHL